MKPKTVAPPSASVRYASKPPPAPPGPRVHWLTWLIVVAALGGAGWGMVTFFTHVYDTWRVAVAGLSLLVGINALALDALRWPSRRDWSSTLLLYEASALMLCWIFPQYGLWPLAFVALVPWTVVTCRVQRAWLVHWLSFAAGTGFFLVALRWLMPVTGLGYVALAMYLGVYWTLAAWAIRTARRHGVSPAITLPIVWVACEYLRGVVMSGFPWLFVGHAFYQQLPLIQIADITGAYGVSFVVLLVNGVLAELCLHRWRIPNAKPATKQLYGFGAATVAVLVGVLSYGWYQLGAVDHAARAELRGPEVAVVQEDFPLVSTPPYGEHPFIVLAEYLALGAAAAAEEPDLVVFPETVWSAFQNAEFVEAERAAVDDEYADTWAYGKQCDRAVAAFARGDYPDVNAVISQLESTLRALANRSGRALPTTLPRLPAEGGPPVNVVVGSMSLELFPNATYPKSKRYNSALVYDPDGTQRRERYDKNHLVPFGELVPFRNTRLHFLYRWLNRLSPFSAGGTVDYSLTPGDGLTVFELQTDARAYRFGTPICYEDTTPYLVRRYVWRDGERRTDFLLNISNDGWFQHSHELPQHLAICVFRAVENRISIARAVNTGISGFIDPDGRIYSRVTDADGRSFRYGVGGIVGYDVEPVYLDPRTSVYGRLGDLFALVCVLLSTLLWLSAVFERWVLNLKHQIDRRRNSKRLPGAEVQG